jgi:hypothetical protein
MTTMSKSALTVAMIGCAVALAGADQGPVGAAAASAASSARLRGSVLFFDPHPRNDGKAGYVLAVRLRHPLPRGQRIVARVGENFPVTGLDPKRACYSGGVRGYGATKKVRYGGVYRVRIWIGTHPDPDHGTPTAVFQSHLRHAATGKARVGSDLGCSDPNGYMQ